jgi:hypothetical protein
VAEGVRAEEEAEATRAVEAVDTPVVAAITKTLNHGLL